MGQRFPEKWHCRECKPALGLLLGLQCTRWNRSPRSKTVHLSATQLIALAFAISYLATFKASWELRNARTWEAIIARLKPVPLAEGRGLWTGPAARTAETRHKLWIRFHNAGVMQEMAEYAVRNCAATDPAFLSNLRRDAVYVRTAAAWALVRGPRRR